MSRHWTWAGDGRVIPVTAKRMIRDQAEGMSRGQKVVTVEIRGGTVVGVEAPRGTVVVVVDWDKEDQGE